MHRQESIRSQGYIRSMVASCWGQVGRDGVLAYIDVDHDEPGGEFVLEDMEGRAARSAATG
ncbi:MAG: hypothetical protein ABI836_09035 [Gemmatimonadota bacterium]